MEPCDSPYKHAGNALALFESKVKSETLNERSQVQQCGLFQAPTADYTFISLDMVRSLLLMMDLRNLHTTNQPFAFTDPDTQS